MHLLYRTPWTESYSGARIASSLGLPRSERISGRFLWMDSHPSGELDQKSVEPIAGAWLTRIFMSLERSDPTTSVARLCQVRLGNRQKEFLYLALLVRTGGLRFLQLRS